MCFSQCLHLDISEDILHQATIDEKNVKSQKGNNNYSTIRMTTNNDYVGSIAQNIVFKYFDDIGIAIEKTAYFDKLIHKDLCDFEYRGRNDIKGSPTNGKWNEVYSNTSFLLSDHQMGKKVDWYTFVRVDLDHNIAHIAGVISYKDFFEKSEEMKSDRIKSPCHFITAKHLKPFRDYVYAV